MMVMIYIHEAHADDVWPYGADEDEDAMADFCTKPEREKK